MSDELLLPSIWQSSIDDFFSQLEKGDPESFFSALATLKSLDTYELARARITSFTKHYFSAPLESRKVSDSIIPHFGHIAIAVKDDVAISFSVRNPISVSFPTLSSLDRHEYHRVEVGELYLTECTRNASENKQHRYLPAITSTVNKGGEIERRAGDSAFAIIAKTQCFVFSVSGWKMSDFTHNVDANSGKVISQSFTVPEDSMLANVLELCSIMPGTAIESDLSRYLHHGNHRIRLASMKACLTNSVVDPIELAHLASKDEHPLIKEIGMRMTEAAT
jgi:hypothetical protein